MHAAEVQGREIFVAVRSTFSGTCSPTSYGFV
jgi:hypothetical protein